MYVKCMVSHFTRTPNDIFENGFVREPELATGVLGVDFKRTSSSSSPKSPFEQMFN